MAPGDGTTPTNPAAFVSVRRRGRALAAGSFALAAAVACIAAFGVRGIFSGPGLTFLGGAVLGAAIFGPLLWSALAARATGFSWLGSAGAALVTIPAANLVMWIVAWLTMNVFQIVESGGNAVTERLGEAVRQTQALPFFVAATTVRFAFVTLPLSLLAAFLTTAWCRRRLRLEGHPPYGSRIDRN